MMTASFIQVYDYSREVKRGLYSNLRAVGVSGVVVLWLAFAVVVLAARDRGRECGGEF